MSAFSIIIARALQSPLCRIFTTCQDGEREEARRHFGKSSQHVGPSLSIGRACSRWMDAKTRLVVAEPVAEWLPLRTSGALYH